MTILYLIRHATPDWNRKDIPYHLPPGPPLTEQGKAEALALGDYLRRKGVQTLVASPLERACHTAQLAAGTAGIPWVIDDDLLEWQPGESPEAVRVRMHRAARRLLEREGLGNGGPEYRAGVVSHGGPLGALLREFGMEETTLESWRKFDHRNPLPPAGVWQASPEVVERGVQRWRLELDFIPEVVLA